MTETDRDNAMLDDMFRAARAGTRSEASPDLLARVLADAEAHQPQSMQLTTQNASRGRRRWQQFVAVIGGWPSVTGLAAATVAGVWIGFSASATMLPYGLTSLVDQDTESYLQYITAGDLFEDEEL